MASNPPVGILKLLRSSEQCVESLLIWVMTTTSFRL